MSSVPIVTDDYAMMAPRAAAAGVSGRTNVFALLRLLPGGDRDKDIEIPSLRQQPAVVQRRLPLIKSWIRRLS